MRYKRELFGGALTAAGLTTSASFADFGDFTASVIVEAHASGDTMDGSIHHGLTAYWSYAASVPGGASSSTFNKHGLYTYAQSGYGAAAYTRTTLHFTAATDMTLHLEWSFNGGYLPGAQSEVNINGYVGDDYQIFFFQNGFGSGQQALDIAAGTQLTIVSLLRGLSIQDGASSFSATIPAPGVGGLVGIAATVRRRRRG